MAAFWRLGEAAIIFCGRKSEDKSFMRIKYPTLFLAILCYSLFIGAAILLWPVAPAVAILVMAVMGALPSWLALECLHGHRFRNPHLNEALAYLPLTLAYPYRRYRSLHLKHNENASLTDPFEDLTITEAGNLTSCRVRCAGCCGSTMRFLAVLYWSLAVRCGFLRAGGAILKGESDVRRAWAHHVARCVRFSCCSGRWVFRYGSISLVCWPALSLIALRSFAEHRWRTEDGRCIIVEKSPCRWLFLNNNLHLVHHAHPGA